MTRFAFYGDFPAETKPILDELLEKYRWLLPPWMKEVAIRYDHLNGDASATAECRLFWEYRFGQIFIKPAWFTLIREEQERAVLHEFLHFSINPLADYCKEVIDLTTESGSVLQELTKREVTRRMEMGISDLEERIWARDNPG